jgi:hypothetical protein
MSDSILRFCNDGERNPFGFSCVHSSQSTYSFEIDGFPFLLTCRNEIFSISSQDDFLKTFVSNFNVNHVTDLEGALTLLTSEYSSLYDIEKSPLYNNQDVYELENDNYDLKVFDRVRFREEDFNVDIYSLIFDFLEPIGIFYF